MRFSERCFKRIVLLFLFSFGFIFSLRGYEYNLAICTIFKDNAPYLKEWIEFHRMLGVEHFYLLDNSSSDNPKRILQKYIKNNIVTLVDWPNRDEDQWGGKIFAWVSTTQIPAYYHGCALARKKAKWIAFIDTDEFIVPMHEDSIPKFLDRHDKAPGIAINWQCYGTSHVQKVPRGKLMIELLKLKCKRDDGINKHTKLIIKSNQLFEFIGGPHRCVYANQAQNYLAPLEEIRINHYINRTVEFFYDHKIKNKEKMDNTKWNEATIKHWEEIGNDIEDNVMDRFVPSLKKRMGFNN